MAAKKSGSPAMNYIVSRLKRNPNAAYADVRQGAEAQGMTIHPIMYGRAKLSLGLVKAGSGQAKKAAEKRAAKKAAKRGPGRPRKVGRPAGPRARSNGSAVDAVQALLGDMKSRQRDNEQLRATLEKVRQLIDSAL